ncbi:MAG: hypothetical protein ACKO2T_14125 [Microcystis aeruginosa]
MFKNLTKTALLATATLIGVPSVLIQPTFAQIPSLGDGIICTATGKTAQGVKLYVYTSEIDDDSINKKEPVTLTMVSPVSDVVEGQILVVNKDDNTVTIDNFAAATPPEMQPVGLAVTTYQGRNTFSGKSQAGTPVSFTLENNLRTIKVKHGGDSFTGVCH